MSFRSSLRPLTRRLSTAVESMDKNATKGPKLPAGNDPSASHGPQHATADTSKWRMISIAFALPVGAFAIIQSLNEHKHIDPPPEYPYLKMANRVPRFPWGDDDLIGTNYERHAKKHGEGEH